MSAVEETRLTVSAPGDTLWIAGAPRTDDTVYIPSVFGRAHDLRALLIATRVGVVEHQGVSYALTWDEGES